MFCSETYAVQKLREHHCLQACLLAPRRSRHFERSKMRLFI